MKGRARSITWGILLILVAVLLIANQIGFSFALAGLGWFSLILLAGCAFAIISGIVGREPWSVLLGAGVGYYILQGVMNWPKVSLWVLLLAIFIGSAGISMIFGRQRKVVHIENGTEYQYYQTTDEDGNPSGIHSGEDKIFSGGNYTIYEDYISGDIVFSGITKYIESQQFRGGSYSLVFSHGVLYFDHAGLFENKAVLENDVVFSGLDLYVPSHWNVEDQTGKVFSSHNIGRTINPGNPTLILRGDVVFGGIKIHYI